MNQKTIAIRLKTDQADADNLKFAIVGVTEAANRLGVSERTIYRLLKTGDLERVDKSIAEKMSENNVSQMSDDRNENVSIKSCKRSLMSDKSDAVRFKESDKYSSEYCDLLKHQLREKDVQIAQMLLAQQDMAQTIQRLQEQMYELAHLVLTHNVAAAQAKAEAEIKLQEKTSASERRGWQGLLGQRGKK